MYYDPILAKLITFGEDRKSARLKMVQALSDYVIMGIKTQIDFLKAVMLHPEFSAGNTNTDFIPQHMSEWKKKEEKYIEPALIAAAISSLRQTSAKTKFSKKIIYDPWISLGSWEI